MTRDQLRNHPTRARILALVEEDAARSLDPDDLRRELSSAKPSPAAVAYHLSVLRRAGLLPVPEAR